CGAAGCPRSGPPSELAAGGEAEPRADGRRLGEVLRGGDRIGLAGELGAGTTCLVRGLAEGLGIPPEQVRSPSFPILLPYAGGRPPPFPIHLFKLPARGYHPPAPPRDLYRNRLCPHH